MGVKAVVKNAYVGHDSVRELRAWLIDNGVSVEQAASRMRVAGDELRAFLMGRGTPSGVEIAAKVRDLVAAGAPVEVGFIETRTARIIFSFLREIKELRAMGLLLGGAGIGKTLAAREFMRKNKGVCYVRAHPSASAPAFLREVARALPGEYTESGSSTQERITNALKRHHLLLVVDECDFLRARSFHCLRLAWDATEKQAGIVWIGTSDWLRRLRNCDARHGTVAQFVSRFARFLSLPASDEDELRLIAASHGLRRDLLDVLKIGSAGSLRRAVSALEFANDLGHGEIKKADLLTAFGNMPPAMVS